MDFRKGYIYVIINKVNGKYYYGKTFNVKNRWNAHLRNARKKINRRLYDAINHYGIECFAIFQIGSYIAQTSDELTKILNEKEKFLIALSNSTNSEYGYNMADGGDGGYLGIDAIEKMANKKRGVSLTSEHKKHISEGNRGKNVGKHCSKEQKEFLKKLYQGKTYKELYGEKEAIRISEKKRTALKGKTRKPFSEEWKRNIGKYQEKTWDEKMGKERAEKRKNQYKEKFKGNKISLKNVDLEIVEKFIREGKHFREIAKILNISTTTLNYKFREKYKMTPYEYSKTI